MALRSAGRRYMTASVGSPYRPILRSETDYAGHGHQPQESIAGISAPMGVLFVKRPCWPGPVTSCRWAGWDCCAGFPRSCRVRAVAWSGVQLERPQPRAPGRARARTNELDVGERRPMIGGEEEPAGYRFQG
jgi:hypothetical protein